MPAAYLGRFSWKDSKRPRERPLWAWDLRSFRPFIITAKDAAWQIGLYDAESKWIGGSPTLDVAWGYESSLPRALDSLANSPIVDGQLWTLTLVPFVAGLFVRGPDFHQQYRQRFPEGLETVAPAILRPDHSTAGRLLDFQHLLAPVMTSRWTVLHFAPSAELVTSDTGFATASTPVGESYVVPLDRCTALVITPSTSRQVLSWVDGHWVALLEHYDVADSDVPDLKRAMGAFARHAIYGPTRESVEQASQQLAAAPHVGPAMLGAEVDLGCHLYDYFRVVSALQSTPADAQSAADSIDWPAVERLWPAPVVFELLFPERTVGGVQADGHHITVDLTLGAAVRKVRRAAGDFRKGAMTLMERPFAEAAARIVPKPQR
jgi:hypothetical protein